MFGRALVVALLLMLPIAAQAVGLNAGHFFARDDLKNSDDSVLINGNTRYTPDLDLGSSGLNELQGTDLDEVYLNITFKPGVTPNINNLLEIRYGNEFVFTPNGQRLYSRVVGQNLLVWYGFEDRPDFGQTHVPSNSRWSFTISGDHPVAEVEFFLSSHRNGSLEMLELQPFNNLHLVALEEISRLFIETPATPVSGKPLTSAQKLIVLVHGRNPNGYLNNFAPSSLIDPLSTCWADLALNLVQNPVVQNGKWTVARYNWSGDASTGPNELYLPWTIRNANASRDAASAHGAKLGQLVRNAGATHVQFIAHSAGNWAARRAAAYLKEKNPAIQIQITALDPFVNDDDPTEGRETDFDLQPAFELTSLWTTHRDNFYVADNDILELGSDAVLGWTSGDFSTWNNANIENFSLYEPWMKNHNGPIAWYAESAKTENLGDVSFLSAGVGFLSSLPVRLASANDSFPGDVLFGASGNATWFNYQATAQPSEPAHDSATRAWRSVWGKWTAPASGTVTFDTLGGDFYNVLAAYSGSTLTTLTQIAHDSATGKGPGQCQISFSAVAGQTYYIAVDGVLGQAGQSPLHWQMTGGGGPTFTVSITAPVGGATVSGNINVSAFANGASKVEFYLDGVRQFTDTATPFNWSWNTATAANDAHTLAAKSYSGATLLATSPNVSVTVNNSGTPPACPDVNEPNDSSLAATPLPFGTVTNGYICTATDVDWFRVEVGAPGVLTFDLFVPAANDYDLELYGPDATYLTGSYRDTGLAENITHNATVTGIYYARVYGYPAGNGSFSATVLYTLTARLGSELAIHVNFGSATNNNFGNPVAPTPPGYVQDIGEVFGDRGNGYTYGWDSDLTFYGRYRQNAASPDLRYDTLMHLQKNSPISAIWEIAIPNGTYRIHVVAGDSDFTDERYQFTYENNVTTTTYAPTIGPRWIEFTNDVTVIDGRLSLTSGTNAVNNKICFIDITPLFILRPAITLQPASQTTSQGESVMFTVVVSGTPPFTFQWLRNGTPIVGASAATLMLANAQPAQAGSYTVQITGPGGTVTSAPAILSFVTDSDGDGLPDSWELAHGLLPNNSADASADPDHDGASNFQEYLAGTDPKNSTSVFRVTAAQMPGAGFQITFNTVTGRTYRVEGASALTGPWTVWENHIPGTAAPIQLTDTVSPASASRFYRVVVE